MLLECPVVCRDVCKAQQVPLTSYITCIMSHTHNNQMTTSSRDPQFNLHAYTNVVHAVKAMLLK